MEVNDYVHDLSKAKESFSKKTDEQRDTYNRDLKNQQETFDYKADKLQKINNESLAKIEDEYKSQIDDHADSSRASLREKQDTFRRKLRDQVEETEKERRYTSDKFRNKLQHINDSFDSSTRELKNSDQSKYDSMEGKYRRLLDDSKEGFVGEIRDMQDRTDETVRDMRGSERGTMSKLLRRNNLEKEDIIRSNGQNEAMNKSIHNEQLRSINTTHVDELKNLKDISDSQIGEIRNRAKLQEGDQASSFNDAYEGIRAANEKRGERLKNQYGQELRKLNDGHERSEGLMKRSVAESIAREHESAESAALAKEQLIKKYEHKLKNFKEKMDNDHEGFQDDVDHMNENIKTTLAERSRTHSEQLEDKRRESHEFAQDMMGRFRDERLEITDAFRKRQQIEDDNHNFILNSERDNSKRSVAKQSKAFSDRLEQLELKNSDQLRAVRDAYAKSEKDFIQDTRRKFNYDFLEQREAGNAKVQALDEQNAQRVETEKAKLVSQQAYYDNKLDALEKKMEDEMKKQLIVHDIQKEDAQRDNQQVVKDMQVDHRKSFIELKRRFDKQMSKTKRENDKLVTKIITSKDDEIRNTNQTAHRNLKVLESDYARRFKNLTVSHELAMENMIRKYEDMIDQMKVNYEVKIDKAAFRGESEV